MSDGIKSDRIDLQRTRYRSQSSFQFNSAAGNSEPSEKYLQADAKGDTLKGVRTEGGLSMYHSPLIRPILFSPSPCTIIGSVTLALSGSWSRLHEKQVLDVKHLRLTKSC